MRFKVGEFQPGAPGQPGVIKASRVVARRERPPTGRDGDRRVHADRGEHRRQRGRRLSQPARVQARLPSRLPQRRLDERGQPAARSTDPRRHGAGHRSSGAISRWSSSRSAGQASKLDFAFDLAAAGVLPVRIEITNLTPRTYTLDVAEIRLTRADRERVAALTPAEAGERIANAKRAARRSRSPRCRRGDHRCADLNNSPPPRSPQAPSARGFCISRSATTSAPASC